MQDKKSNPATLVSVDSGGVSVVSAVAVGVDVGCGDVDAGAGVLMLVILGVTSGVDVTVGSGCTWD